MKKANLTRRQFVAAATAASVAAAAASTIVPAHAANAAPGAGKLAILGGEPVRKNKNWPDWPYWDEKVVELRRQDHQERDLVPDPVADRARCPRSRRSIAELIGAKFCVATGSGTQALHTCVEALGIGPGDEVITSPYTDPGTIASILSSRALPVLADLDPASYQLDPDDVERRITENTRAIMPVHMMGQPCNMERIMADRQEAQPEGDRGRLPRRTWPNTRGKKLGTIGDVGCFSFQTSKTIACGEGGAIIGNDEELMDRCYTVHNHGTSRRGRTEVIGPKYRMNEFEAAVLLGQWPGVQERFLRRNENAAHLTARLKGFPGVVPQKLYEGTASGSFYLYAMTLQEGALQRRGPQPVPQGGRRGRREPEPLHRPRTAQGALDRPHPEVEGLPEDVFPRGSRSTARRTVCPNCDQVCQEMVMIWASGPLLGTTEGHGRHRRRHPQGLREPGQAGFDLDHRDRRAVQPALGAAGVERQGHGHAPAAVGVGSHEPVRMNHDRLVDQLEAAFRLADRLDRERPEVRRPRDAAAPRRCPATRRSGPGRRRRTDRAACRVGRGGSGRGRGSSGRRPRTGRPAKLNSTPKCSVRSGGRPSSR